MITGKWWHSLALGMIAIFAFSIFVGYNNTQTDTSKKKVFISQIIEHPALNMTIRGIVDGLQQAGYTNNNVEIRLESAQGSPSLAVQIANKFMSKKPDVVVGLGTVSAQALMQPAAKNNVPLIFSSVTDPVFAKLVQELNEPGGHVSGVSNFIEFPQQLELFLKIQPQLKSLGIIYNPGELNSISIIEKLSVACQILDIKLVKQAVNKTADVMQAATKLAATVDAIFISNDNTALSALQSIIISANQRGIPVYVSDIDAVIDGALAALGPSQYKVGLQTGKMIARVLDGDDLADMPVEFPTTSEIYINQETAENLHIPLLRSLVEKANAVYTAGKRPKK